MKISSVSKNNFGIKIPEKFTQTIVKQCTGFSLKDADILAEKIRKLPPDTVTITNLYSKSRKNSLFGPRYNMMGADLEVTLPDGTTEKKEIGRLIVKRKCLNSDDILDVITKEMRAFGR